MYTKSGLSFIAHILWVCTLFFIPAISFSQYFNDQLIDTFKKGIHKDIPYKEMLKIMDQFIRDSVDPNNQIGKSLLYNEISKYNHRNKDYKNAILNSQKAIDIQKVFIDSVPSLVNRSYNNLAYFYLYNSDESNALKTFKTLISLPYKDTYTVKAYAIGLTDLLAKRGDYFKLRDYLLEAEKILLQIENKELKKELYRIYLSLSRLHFLITGNNHLYTSLAYLRKAEKANNSPSFDIRILIQNQYGIIYNTLGDFENAKEHYEQALDLVLSKKSSYQDKISILYNNLGVICKRMEKTRTAYSYFNKALDYNPYNTMVYDNLGDYYLDQANFEKALLHYQKAVDFNVKQYDHHDYNTLQDIEVLAAASDRIGLVNDLKDKANAWLSYHQKNANKEFLRKALITVNRADQLIDIIRSESTEQQSKFFWRKKGVDLYLLATRICYELQDSERAFYFMEKSKSLSLLENLTHEEAKKRGGLPEELQEKEYALRRGIIEASLVSIQDSTMTKAERQSMVFSKKRAYEDFLTSLENEYPEYYNFKKQVEVMSLKDCYNYLVNPTTAVIQYILSDEEGYGIYISQNKTEFFKIVEAKKLNEQIIKARKLLQQPFFSSEDQKSYQKISFSMFQKLLPFHKKIQFLQNQKIIIIPDHTLQTFPFEALFIEDISQESKNSYVIDHCEISYLYSVSLQQQVMKKKRAPKYDFLGFAPVTYANKNLSALRRSKEKMRKIGKLFSGQSYLNQQASKKNFLQESNKYNIIHLSTHASSLTDKMPWIAFYEDELSLTELYFVKNQADLVVLDACQTGIGELQPGEGVMSLTRGFFHSGAKSVISSLWNTNEKSSNEIIKNFYQNLKQGLDKSVALTKSKLEYIKSHQGSEVSPYFWAPLILTGDTGELTAQNPDFSGIWIVWLLSIIFLLVIGVCIYRNSSKKNRAA